MNRVVLEGLNGANPLGFLGALGLLRILNFTEGARLGFLDDGSFRPFVMTADADLGGRVAADALQSEAHQPWKLSYDKLEKRGTKTVRDLKPPPQAFAQFLEGCLSEWNAGHLEAAEYAAAFATSTARDGKGNTKPTAFHFTAANQQFLGTVDEIRASIDRTWAHESLFGGRATRPGSNLRWDPAAERNWALMAHNPVDDGTSVDAPLEWLGFRALPLFPCVPWGAQVRTTGVTGRGDQMQFSWPLWSVPTSIDTIRSLLTVEWADRDDRKSRSIFATCRSSIRRTSQGFGNFGPASVTA